MLESVQNAAISCGVRKRAKIDREDRSVYFSIQLGVLIRQRLQAQRQAQACSLARMVGRFGSSVHGLTVKFTETSQSGLGGSGSLRLVSFFAIHTEMGWSGAGGTRFVVPSAAMTNTMWTG